MNERAALSAHDAGPDPMSASRQAAIAGGSQGDGGRSSLLGCEAGAGGPRAGQSLSMQRMACCNDQLQGLVSAGDPRLELADQVKDSHAAFRAMVMAPFGARAQ